jgi:hypothetical protein
MENKSRKEMTAAYKERKTLGGVYAIKNLKNGKIHLEVTANLQSSQNRFEFSRNTGSCVTPLLQKDWKDYGAENFAFEILEKIEMKDTQTPKEFQEDLKILYDLWTEKIQK